MTDKTILLIEDNPDDVLITKMAFEKNNLLNPITVIEDGALVADYFEGKGRYTGRNINEMPAIVLLDLKLPNIPGLDILTYIRSNENTKLLPVIILTSSLEEKDIIASYLGGANSYVRKPVEFSNFLEAVQTLGLFWLLYNKTPLTR
jgi:two-component system response regulator